MRIVHFQEVKIIIITFILAYSNSFLHPRQLWLREISFCFFFTLFQYLNFQYGKDSARLGKLKRYGKNTNSRKITFVSICVHGMPGCPAIVFVSRARLAPKTLLVIVGFKLAGLFHPARPAPWLSLYQHRGHGGNLLDLLAVRRVGLLHIGNTA